MKKVIIRVILVIIGLLIVSKIYHFIIIHKVHQALENFINEENRYYSVSSINSNKNSTDIKIWKKDNIVKQNWKKDNTDLYCYWKDFKDNQEYLIDLQNKVFEEENLSKVQKDSLTNLPKLIFNLYKNNQIHIKQLFKIKYIRLIQYNNQKCYKIQTASETIIIDKATYLPVYSSTKTINSNYNKKDLTENTYQFNINEVTDEDVSLPNLEEYTKNSLER